MDTYTFEFKNEDFRGVQVSFSADVSYGAKIPLEEGMFMEDIEIYDITLFFDGESCSVKSEELEDLIRDHFFEEITERLFDSLE